jgi:peptide/nickel transport system permease protein
VITTLSRFGLVLVLLGVFAAVAAPVLAPHATDDRFPGLLNAPPTLPHVIDSSGRWRAPFIYPWRLADRLLQRYERDSTTRVPLVWLGGRGRVVTSSDDARAPLLLLGADSYGRDVFSRLLFGARVSLGLAILSALGSMIVGGLVGAVAGYAGGTTDDVLMRATDVVMVLPAMYVALALRSVLPLVLAPFKVFVFLAGIFAVVGAPFISRGVRGIVRTERRLDYAVAARSLGAGHARLLGRHLLPATRGFIAVQMTMLVPAFIIAEATLSYVGLGFPEPISSWGTMLHEASNIRTFADFPWLLSPAGAIFLFVLGLNLVLQETPAIEAALVYNGGDESVRRARSDSDALR